MHVNASPDWLIHTGHHHISSDAVTGRTGSMEELMQVLGGHQVRVALRRCLLMYCVHDSVSIRSVSVPINRDALLFSFRMDQAI